MGPKGAIEVLRHKKIAAIEDETERAAYVAKAEEDYKDKFANPYKAAEYGYIDDVIEPRNSRFQIIRALQALQQKKTLCQLKNMPIFHYNRRLCKKELTNFYPELSFCSWSLQQPMLPGLGMQAT